MLLLLDTDAFCKLAAARLLEDSLRAFGAELSECGRLAALPHMLRRGRLRAQLGDAISEELIPRAREIPRVSPPDADWLDRLAHVSDIDPGEAQLFALAAQDGLIVVTGDKRALAAVASLPDVCAAIAGRVVTLEAILIRLCHELGIDEVRRRVAPIVHLDNMLTVCFSPTNNDPVAALNSYFRSAVASVRPLTLWDPRPEGET